MPTRDIPPSNPRVPLSERQEAEMRLKAMREAVEVGIADIEAGRYLEFDTADALRDYLSALVDEAIGDSGSPEDRT